MSNISFSFDNSPYDEPRLCCVYILQNLASGHLYVGATIDLRGRFEFWKKRYGPSKDWRLVVVRTASCWKEAHQWEIRVLYKVQKLLGNRQDLLLNVVHTGRHRPNVSRDRLFRFPNQAKARAEFEIAWRAFSGAQAEVQRETAERRRRWKTGQP